MTLIRLVLLLFGCSSWFGLAASQAPASRINEPFILLHFDKVSDMLAEQNPSVQASELWTRAASERKGFEEHARYPLLQFETGWKGAKEVDGSGDHAPYLRLEASLSLYRGERETWQDQLMDLEAAIRAAEAAFTKWEKEREAQRLYIQLAEIRAKAELWKSVKELNEQQRRTVKRRVAAGLSTPTDLLEFDLYAHTIVTAQAQLDEEDAKTSQELRTLLGIKDSHKLNLDRRFSLPSQTEPIPPSDGKNHPELKILAMKSQQAQLASQVPSMRDLALFASYEGTRQAKAQEPGALADRELAAGLRLSIPLEDQANGRKEAFAKQKEARAYELWTAQKVTEISGKRTIAIRRLESIRTLFKNMSQHLRTADLYLKNVTEEFTKGLRSHRDLLEASQTLVSAQLEQVELIHEYYRTRSELLVASSDK